MHKQPWKRYESIYISQASNISLDISMLLSALLKLNWDVYTSVAENTVAYIVAVLQLFNIFSKQCPSTNMIISLQIKKAFTKK